MTEPISHVDVSLKVDGKMQEYRMPCDWAAYKAVLQAGVDPADYTDERHKCTTIEKIKIVHAGVTAGGADLSFDDVGQAMFAHGMVRYDIPVAVYVIGLLSGGITRKTRAKVERDAKKKSPAGTSSKARTKSRSARGGSSRTRSGG